MRTQVVALLLLLASTTLGCKSREKAHTHGSEHPPGHDHHKDDHGHDEAVERVTRWTDQFELFAEHPPPTSDKAFSLLAHLTVLDGFRALTDAKVRLELDGPESLRAGPVEAKRPGIFEIEVTPRREGTYRVRMVIEGSVAGVIEGFEIKVHPAGFDAGSREEEHGDQIEFLKEQQWGVPFGTAFASKSSLVEAIEMSGTIETPPGGSADIGAPVAGRVVTLPQGLPRPGDGVKKGQALATLAPAPSSPEDAARAKLAVAEAESRETAANKQLERFERLRKDDAVSERELEDARRDAEIAKKSVHAARQASSLFSGASGGGGGGSWRLVSPIAGILSEVRAKPGASVTPGEVLFRVVDTRELWLRARVPEQDAPRVRTDRAARFQPAGIDEWLAIDVGTADAGASVVTVGRSVDPVARTVDVIYGLRAPDPRLRVGGLARVSLPTGKEFEGVVVPRTAVVSDAGRDVVFVQADGEHFEQRTVRIAVSAADRVGIADGIREGERIVVRGAHLVKLAARSGTSAPHGHIH